MVSSVRSTIRARVPCQTSVLPIGILLWSANRNAAYTRLLWEGNREGNRHKEQACYAPAMRLRGLNQLWVWCFFTFAIVGNAQSPDGLSSSVQAQLPSLIETYKHFHRN